ncbi:hypothetical protein AAFC00_004876 [Neodothiora populina]
MTVMASALSVNNIFTSIQSGAPPSQVTQRADHPVGRLGIANQTTKLETNKFYANFFLGSQASSSFTHPYSVSWSKGSGAAGSWGLSVSHIERSQLAYGPGDPAGYFINPIGIQSLILSANELNQTTNLTTDSLDAFSVNVNLLPASGKLPAISFPLVQGMAFVTGVYSNATPKIESSVAFLSVAYIGAVASNSTYKYQASLGDGTTWYIYVTTSQAGYPVNAFSLVSSYRLQGAVGFNGFIQVAKQPTGNASSDAQRLYDASAGTYPTSASVSGSVSGTSGTYGFTWTKGGITSRPLMMFALPHHVEVLSRSGVNVTDIQLTTTTKGLATAVVGNSWTITEPDLPVDMGFAPWSPARRSINSVSSTAATMINSAGSSELSQDIHGQTYLDSMYYSGKALAKFAAIVYSLHDIVGNTSLSATGLQKLETAFAAFVNNTQINPLVYESAWGGVVSSGTYRTGDSGLDFGNTYYNDHHFHYGYFVYAAAVIGYLDPNWLNTGSNKAWVNMLVRDYANPISNDTYFPFSRSFDWYHGHSWAKGLFESGDGKDEESSSEDAMASYAIKMWGRSINDAAMEARGNLMLAMQARSFQKYFLYTSDNPVEPARFIGNKVSGILFENKIDHTTYFGSNAEYIEGIHMLPLMPFSTLTRTQKFVSEEWDKYFSSGRADSVAGGWRGMLYANLAIIDPRTSYLFFSRPNFDMSLLDGGASLTWYLTWSAAMGGSPAAAAADATE